jgi:hypothetical protein
MIAKIVMISGQQNLAPIAYAGLSSTLIVGLKF